MKPVLTAEEYRRVDKAYEGDLISGDGPGRVRRSLWLPHVQEPDTGNGWSCWPAEETTGEMATWRRGISKPERCCRRGASTGAPRRHSRQWMQRRRRRQPESASSVSNRLPRPPWSSMHLFGGGVRSGLPEEILGWIDTPGSSCGGSTTQPASTPIAATSKDAAFVAIGDRHVLDFEDGPTFAGDGPDYCGQVTVVDIGIDGGNPLHVCGRRVRRSTPLPASQIPQVVGWEPFSWQEALRG